MGQAQAGALKWEIIVVIGVVGLRAMQIAVTNPSLLVAVDGRRDCGCFLILLFFPLFKAACFQSAFTSSALVCSPHPPNFVKV